jgi:D-arabinose 1-dehydrogenase-like Zn-dependent alcohol dehydrogenase
MVSGDLKASVEETFPLSDIHTALSALDSGRVRGKLAVRIDE